MTEHNWRRGFDKRTDSFEYVQGQVARSVGMKAADNPFRLHTSAHSFGDEGWHDADEEMNP